MQPTFASPHLRHRSPIKLVSNAPPSWLEGFANRLMVAAFDPRFDPDAISDGREFKCPICQYFLTLVPNPDKKSNDNLGEIGFFFYLLHIHLLICLFIFYGGCRHLRPSLYSFGLDIDLRVTGLLNLRETVTFP